MGGVSELFYETMMWAQRAGCPVPLDSVEGAWEADCGEYHVAINGHREPVQTSGGQDLQPFNVFVTSPVYLMAATYGPGGGMVAGASEEELTALFRRSSADNDEAARQSSQPERQQ